MEQFLDVGLLMWLVGLAVLGTYIISKVKGK